MGITLDQELKESCADEGWLESDLKERKETRGGKEEENPSKGKSKGWDLKGDTDSGHLKGEGLAVSQMENEERSQSEMWVARKQLGFYSECSGEPWED